MKDKIVELLMKTLDHAYCDNCGKDPYGGACDECHRKYQRWCLGQHTAQHIADDIIDIKNGNKAADLIEAQKELIDALRKQVDKRTYEKQQIMRKIQELREGYVDACNICTHGDCDKCNIRQFIDELEKILL